MARPDLSSLYTWNTKQVFVYITATYPSADPSSPPSRSIVWDAILPSRLAPWHQNQYIHPGPPPEPQGKTVRRSRAVTKGRMYAAPSADGDSPGRLRLKGQKPKYVVTDHTGTLTGRAAGANVTLELGWNAQPWVGALLWRGTLEHFGAAWPMEGGASEPFAFPEPKAAVKMETVRGAESNRGRPA
jgi:signal peptidase complex subunit 3